MSIRVVRAGFGRSVCVWTSLLLFWAAAFGGTSGTLTFVGTTQAAAPALTPISFSLDFIIDGKYAPWFVALDKGFYADEGLAVTINPGNGAQAVLQRLEAGSDQFVFADFGGLVLASAAAGAKQKMVAVIYARPPYAIFSLQKQNITSLETLKGKTIASNTGSPVAALFNLVVEQHGYKASDFKWVDVDPNAKLPLTVAGRVDAAENFAVAEPIWRQAAASEGGINMLLAADYGLNTYSNGIVVTNEFLEHNPDIVQGFVKASIRGFKYAFEHPDEAVQSMLSRFPTLDPAVVRQQIDIVKDLISGPGTDLYGLGYMDPQTVLETVTIIGNVYDLSQIPVAEDLYTNSALPGQ